MIYQDGQTVKVVSRQKENDDDVIFISFTHTLAVRIQVLAVVFIKLFAGIKHKMYTVYVVGVLFEKVSSIILLS
jgi:hypothetical protein